MSSLSALNNNRTTPVSSGALSRSGSIVAGGFTITGLDLDTIKDASIKIRIPLREGRFWVPTEFEDAEITIRPDSRASILLELRREGDQLLIDKAELEFNKSPRIHNPVSALEPTNTGVDLFDDIGNEIADAAADLLIHGAYMDEDGGLHVEATIDKPWFIGDEFIDKDIGRIDREVSLPDRDAPIVHGGAPVASRTASNPSIELPDFDTASLVLRKAASMIKTIAYEIRMNTLPTTIEIEGNGANLSSKTETISVNIKGTAKINSDGTIRIEIEDNATPEVASSAGTVDFSGVTDLELVAKDTFSGDGEFHFDTNFSNLVGTIEPGNGVVVPINFVDPDSFNLSGSTGVSIRNNTVGLNHGIFESNVRNFISNDRLRFANGSARLTDGRIDGNISGGFDFDGTDIKLSDIVTDVKITGRDADIDLENLKLRIDGFLKASLNFRNGYLNSRSGIAEAVGRFGYELDPRSESSRGGLELGLLKRNIDFRLLPNGSLSINPGTSGLAEFFAPFFKISGTQENIVPTSGPAAGAVGSPELMSHIETITGAAITTNNQVELLIDGVQSYPKRMELIKNAKESICLQTLIFKFDESGKATAEALVDAAKRGVKVRVIIDCLGNCENFTHLTDGRPLYKMLREGGVELTLYNDPRTSGLGALIEAIKAVPELREITTPDDFKDPRKGLKVLNRIVKIARGQTDAPEEVRQTVADALEKLLQISLGTNTGPVEISTGEIIEEGQALFVAKLAAEMNHRWHEKYLIADGNKAVLGGLNIADEYMFGGTGRMTSNLGIERPAWRDTDIYIAGSAASEAYKAFATNWNHVRGETMPDAPPIDPDAPAAGNTTIQVIQHRPRIDSDHNITNFMIENLKALQPGEKAYIATAYFIPTGALTAFKQALMDAAQRGVDVRIVTNSATTSDAPQINQAAIFPYRELLKAGVRIFERTGDRCMHSKVASFGSNTAAIGSWNADNRSASLNSEALVIAYGEDITQQTKAMIEADMAEDVAVEILLADIESLPFDEEIENSAISLLSDFM